MFTEIPQVRGYVRVALLRAIDGIVAAALLTTYVRLAIVNWLIARVPGATP